ncbi:MAG: DUF4340 domain-containing protein [Chloroflexi bacterium]|nr:DUF4340 domain-containing protein [Chloroflexota bacterium]
MRLNRGTLVLLVASVVVILAVLLLNNQPASAPGPTPEATAEGAGPIFPDLPQDAVVKVEASNSDGTQKTVLTKDEGGAWTVAEATNASDLATDQTKAASVVQTLATLASTDRFALGDQQPADFGLDAPTHIFVLTDKDSKTYTLKVGSKSPTTPRYYTFVNDDTATVYVVQQTTIDDLVNQTLTLPPYVASPTPTVTPTATLNPFSEQELATQTAQAVETFMAQLTATAESTVEATGEATAEVTATPAP